MTPALLLPAALAALAALLLPLLIHLARRSEQRPTDFAALRWLRQKLKPRHRVRFDEWPLLVARLLLLALLAVWLAKPVLFGSAGEAPWVAVMPGIDAAQARAAIDDDKARLHWLAPGFPALDQPSPATAALPFASLLRQLDSELPAAVKLSVLVPEQLQGADAERPQLSRTVEWKVLAGAMPAPKPFAAGAQALTVRYAQDREDGLRYLRAAASAWRPSTTAAFAAAPTTQALPADTQHLVWLAPGPLPVAVADLIRRGGTALLSADTEYKFPASTTVYWRDEVGAPLVEGAALGRGRVLRFTRTFAPATIPQLLQPDFPRNLRNLFASPAPVPARVAARDYAPITGGMSYAQPPRDLRPWLALLIAALLLTERWLATRRVRGVSP
ncbi:BatA domain-containing protein [Pseudoxanthomonas sp. CF125]|uniref:BatA domain-containing protein n=1 Tax=Pseudoxanthomonas sp. CF125 TaxID=1855303 RepID=UPI000891A19E|nr:BatA domain-containing protein [Pseudoxanthomonas sp. CF125]SDR15307.1 N-terminal double-transmembrane domain-containing protein [Pseudoxanthomonas sp. CF125]